MLFFNASYLLSQELYFELIIEDATGTRDTLILGYDLNATDSIDNSFGEINIKPIPFGNLFEARITDYDYSDISQLIYDPTTFHLKKQIKKKDCNSNGFPFVSAIVLSNPVYPITVNWNKVLFNDFCLEKSFITDWHPGGWFDAFHGGEQGPFTLRETENTMFINTTHSYITVSNDTVDVLFICLASINNFTTNIYTIANSTNIKITPNPTLDYLKINLIDQEIENVKIYNFKGQEQVVKMDNNVVNISDFPTGVYFLQLIFTNGETEFNKIIKSTP